MKTVAKSIRTSKDTAHWRYVPCRTIDSRHTVAAKKRNEIVNWHPRAPSLTIETDCQRFTHKDRLVCTFGNIQLAAIRINTARPRSTRCTTVKLCRRHSQNSLVRTISRRRCWISPWKRRQCSLKRSRWGPTKTLIHITAKKGKDKVKIQARQKTNWGKVASVWENLKANSKSQQSVCNRQKYGNRAAPLCQLSSRSNM